MCVRLWLYKFMKPPAFTVPVICKNNLRHMYIVYVYHMWHQKDANADWKLCIDDQMFAIWNGLVKLKLFNYTVIFRCDYTSE